MFLVWGVSGTKCGMGIHHSVWSHPVRMCIPWGCSGGGVRCRVGGIVVRVGLDVGWECRTRRLSAFL